MSLAQLLDYGIKEVPQQSEIRTETIEPNNATNDKSRVFKYTIRNVGFLEGTSMLTFKLKNIAGTNARYRVNLWNGALACIKNAHLRIGDFEVQNAQDVSRIATLLNLNKSVLQRRNVIGHYLGNQLEVNVNGAGANAHRGAGTDATGSGQLWVDETNSGVNFGQVADGTNAAVNSLSIVDTESLNERYGIPLSMIFPCLKGRSLPLFLFTDYNIQMEFEMNFSDEYAYDISMNYAQTAVRDYMCGSTLVGFNDVNLVIDYMLPPSSVLNNFIKQTQQQGGYRFEFPEISVVKKKLTAVPVSKQLQETEHRLGQTGKEVHSVIMMKRFVDYKDKYGLTLSGVSATTATDTNITALANTEKIGYGAVVSSATNATNPHSVVNLGANGTSLVLAGATTGTGAVTDLKIVNVNSQGLGRKVLQGQSIDGCDEEEYNLEVNGLDIYPSFIYNNASHYNQMSLVLDNDLIVPRTMYYTDPNTERQRLAPLEDGLTSNYKPLGCDLRNGNPVMVGGGTVIQSGSPLIFKYKRKPRMNGGGDGTNAANNALGRAIDYRGEMDVDYYITHARVVVVKKLDKGTSVMVSS